MNENKTIYDVSNDDTAETL